MKYIPITVVYKEDNGNLDRLLGAVKENCRIRSREWINNDRHYQFSDPITDGYAGYAYVVTLEEQPIRIRAIIDYKTFLKLYKGLI